MVTSGITRQVFEPACNRQIEFVRLWTAASPRIHAYLVTLVLNWADAEDLLQDVGVTVWMKFAEYDSSRDFVAWACGIARNKVLSFQQKAGHRLVQSEELLARVEQAIDTEPHSLELQREALRRCLRRLTDSERHLLASIQSSETTIKSVAAGKGMSVQALYKTVQRIRSRLFDCITHRLAAWERA